MLMYLDVVGSCNLKCPSCPVGNSENRNSKKIMTLELLGKIVKKAKSEGVTAIYLFNWTEPLIHPKIGEFIRMIESAGMRCGISSNLNLSKNLEACIRGNPTFFRISLSGFTQDAYALGHVGGDIEIVKENMVRLAELKRQLNAKTDVEVYFHRYLDNIDDEDRMRQFSRNLGFRFSSEFALMMPLEKCLAIVDGSPSITERDRSIMDRLALFPTKELIGIAQRHKNLGCGLRDGMLTLDCEGNVILCCTVFDQMQHSVGKYLEMPLSVIQHKKNVEPQCTSICGRCTEYGLHVLSQYPNQGAFYQYAFDRAMKFHAQRLNPSIRFAGQQEADGAFDEEAYLAANADVRAAVRNGTFQSGFQHYMQYGKYENRPGAPRKTV